MAFRRGLFEAIGGFDPALDVGTASRGGGDIDFFHRLVMAGHLMLYEPSALVWHEHRADWNGLRRQLADNGCSFAAHLLTCARNRTIPRPAILRFALVDWIGVWLLRRLLRPGAHRRSLILAELGGMLRGPAAYRRAQREAAMRAEAHDAGPPRQASSRLSGPAHDRDLLEHVAHK
jgi:hypothetical protein